MLLRRLLVAALIEMEKYKWITSIEDEEGEPLTIGQQRYYYWAPWYCIRDEKEKQGVENGDDVRAASYVLNCLGIPAVRVFATESVEGDDGKPAGWVVYWA